MAKHLRNGLYCPQRVYMRIARPTVKMTSPSQSMAISVSRRVKKSSR